MHITPAEAGVDGAVTCVRHDAELFTSVTLANIQHHPEKGVLNDSVITTEGELISRWVR